MGYVYHIDVGKLQFCADRLKTRLWLSALPGSFVHDAKPLLHAVTTVTDDKNLAQVHAAITVSAERNFDQDPRFGLIVLSEIASCALSPAVNDPGTVISVVDRIVRILAHLKENTQTNIQYPLVFVPPVLALDMIEDAFGAIIRDGAAIFELLVKDRTALHAPDTIASTIFAVPAATIAAEASARA